MNRFQLTHLALITFFSTLIGFNTENENLKKQTFYSQASQDEFVYTLLYDLLNKQDSGYYLEIGAGYPKRINNTYFLESNLDWKGTSIDISPNYRFEWKNTRVNKLLLADATKVDYSEVLEEFPQVIDYLSLDIDRAYDLVLEKICFDTHLFKIITIEHDYYRYEDQFRLREREILTELGYYLLCPDVMNQRYIFEDWWIHPDAFPEDVLLKLCTLDLDNKEHTYIISQLKTIIENN